MTLSQQHSESREIYDKLLRGEATSAEYVASLRREVDQGGRGPSTGTVLVCRRCGHDTLRRYVSVATLNLARAERDRTRRLFNRLEAAITHHKRAEGFPDAHDAALYKARDKVLTDYAEGNG